MKLLIFTTLLAIAATQTLDITFSGLEPLGDNFEYEHWLIVDGMAESAGLFDVTADSPTYTATIDITDAQLASAKYVLTIEPSPDSDPAPAATHVMGGAFVLGADGNLEAELSISDSDAFGDDFTSIAGEFILAAPTGGDFQNGIWWLVPGEPMEPGLTLPTLPSGWIYEGWVASADGPISTGTFLTASGEDSDGAGATQGPNGGDPPFPGQDFVVPAPVDLTVGFTAVISIEPVPDNDAAPFTFKPLVKDIISLAPPDTQQMEQNLGSFASGSARLVDSSSSESGEIGQNGPFGHYGYYGYGEHGQFGQHGQHGQHGEQGERGQYGQFGQHGEQGERGQYGYGQYGYGQFGQHGEQGERGQYGYGQYGEQGERGQYGYGQYAERGQRVQHGQYYQEGGF